MLFLCHICCVRIDRLHTVWLPERYYSNNRVYPICFDCCDNYCNVIQKRVYYYLRNRSIGSKKIRFI